VTFGFNYDHMQSIVKDSMQRKRDGVSLAEVTTGSAPSKSNMHS